MKLFQSQYDMGFGTKRIPNFLNSNNNIIFSGLECTSKLVDLNRQNYLKRLKKVKDYKIINLKEHLVIRSEKILRI